MRQRVKRRGHLRVDRTNAPLVRRLLLGILLAQHRPYRAFFRLGGMNVTASDSRNLLPGSFVDSGAGTFETRTFAGTIDFMSLEPLPPGFGLFGLLT
jgi:hypothetical protein